MKRTIKLVLSVATVLVIVGFASVAFAQGAGDAAAVKTQGLASNYGLIALGAGFGIGLAALGGGIGQGRAAASAVDGIARIPQARGALFVPMILGLALIESLVIYELIISFILVGKIS